MNNQQLVRSIMTKSPRTVTKDTPVQEAARLMKKADFGALIVNDSNDAICGIVTDRDIVLRSVADGQDLEKTMVESICSTNTVCLSPDDTIDQAVEKMVKHSIRRVPVVENNMAIGILSLGDLAIVRQPESALGKISNSSPQS